MSATTIAPTTTALSSTAPAPSMTERNPDALVLDLIPDDNGIDGGPSLDSAGAVAGTLATSLLGLWPRLVATRAVRALAVSATHLREERPA